MPHRSLPPSATVGPVPAWFLATAGVAVGANLVAGLTTGATVYAMGGISPFALDSRGHEIGLLPYWNGIAYFGALVFVGGYLRPLIDFFRDGCPAPAPVRARRRALGGPLAVASVGFGLWVASVPVFVVSTLLRTGTWSTDLMSQQVLSPVINGFLAATTTYLLVDGVFRRMVVPYVFGNDRLTRVEGAFALGVLGRMLVFLTAVAFIPIFTLLGLVRSAAGRLDAGMSPHVVLPTLTRASEITFVVYLVIGVGLTLLLARVLTRPLGEMAAALRRIEGGDLDTTVSVTSSDEVGVLGEGVNALVAGLRDRERILTTFGRIVEPAVRDRLLAGDLRLGGELRRVSVLFCDLRSFTAFSEHAPPQEIVSTLNTFFTAMTLWVRECGGFVDKFVGDGMVVVFGLFDAVGSESEGTAAAASVRCALGMQERLDAINVERRRAGDAVLALKVGVHTGEVVAGTIGAQDRHQYTVIGDPVNVAARLQDLCRDVGASVLVSAETYRLAESGGADMAVSMRREFTLRGRQQPIAVCALRR